MIGLVLGETLEQQARARAEGRYRDRDQGYQYAADLTRGSDAGLARKVSDLKTSRAEREIVRHEEFLANHSADDPSYEKRAEELKAAKKRRAEMLIEKARKRVERNPTDMQLRFELGEHLRNARYFREAVPEL